MESYKLEPEILKKAQIWLGEGFDEQTRNEVSDLINYNPQELTESFYTSLEFGTGGLRGIMGPGTNRMNKYTVGMATQGLANYLKSAFKDLPEIKVAIAYDSRNRSRYFAEITANVFAANNIKVYLFDDLRPTPELSFAIRHFSCQSGVVITASHNPPEYNGYKAYWDDGAQMIPPHDKNVIEEVNKISSIDEVKFEGNRNLIEVIGKDVDESYLSAVLSLTLNPDLIRKHHNLKIVYTPLHGTGTRLVPEILKRMGFTSVYSVKEQSIPDGNFPTVKSPNPEEQSALQMAMELAGSIDANLVMATDPDADRVGIAVKNSNGEFILLNGNQTAAILIHYLLSQWKSRNLLKGKEYIVKTIVTSELLKDIAQHNNVKCYDVLTGFKWIADIIRRNEGVETFIGGGEESYGYMIGDFVRDKDAVSSCAMIAETAAWAAEQGKTLYDILLDIYLEYGLYHERLKSLVRKGKSGSEEIKKIMSDYRADPPTSINGSLVVMIRDYQLGIEKHLTAKTETTINLPKSNVLQFFLEDGSKISVRPSGTEPKIKFYFSVNTKLSTLAEYPDALTSLESKLDGIIRDLNI
ncbi:MAG: phospho-sugar mutase [Bacteroidetes bacterium]|nr:phospho-sugar mutase [Bacteroidota bacterium]